MNQHHMGDDYLAMVGNELPTYGVYRAWGYLAYL
jgi:hypothetical protein